MLIVCSFQFSFPDRFKEFFIFTDKLFKHLKLKSKIFSDLKTVKTTVMDINNLTCPHKNCNILVHERLTSKRIII